MNAVWVGVSHVAASDWNLTMSLPAYKGTESPVCASSRKKERADGNGQPVGVKAGATNTSPAAATSDSVLYG